MNDSTTPSMRAGEYDVYTMARAAKLLYATAVTAEGAWRMEDDRGNEDPSTGERPRLVAKEVIDAFCTCQAGRAGGCHHVSQLVQVMRLLQMSATELRAWEPENRGGASMQVAVEVEQCRVRPRRQPCFGRYPFRRLRRS